MTNTTNLYAAPALCPLDMTLSNVQAALAFFAACHELRDSKILPQQAKASVEVLFAQADMFLEALDKSSTVSSNMESLAATERTYIHTLMSYNVTGQALVRGFQRLQKRANDCQKECEELKGQFAEIAKTLHEAHPVILEYQQNKSSSATTKTWTARILIAAAIAAGIATGRTAVLTAGVAEEVLGLAGLAGFAGAGGGLFHRFAGKDHDIAKSIKAACDGVELIVQALGQFADFWDEWRNKMNYLERSCRRVDDDDSYAIDILEGQDLIRQWYDAEQMFSEYTQQTREWLGKINANANATVK